MRTSFQLLVTALVAMTTTAVGQVTALSDSGRPPDSPPYKVDTIIYTHTLAEEYRGYDFLFYEQCEWADSVVTYCGQYAFRICQRDVPKVFNYEISDTLVILNIPVRYGNPWHNEIQWPVGPFTLLVIFGASYNVPDTAVFRMDLAKGECEYAKTSWWLSIAEPIDIPHPSAFMRFTHANVFEMNALLDTVNMLFGEAVEHVALPAGFYPCLPGNHVKEARIGLYRMLNATAIGLLACFWVIDVTCQAEFSLWLAERQLAENKRINYVHD